MRFRRTSLVLMLVLIAGALATASLAGEDSHGVALKEGSYIAKVTALPCDACAPEVKKTLSGIEGVGSVSVDTRSRTVTFAIEKGANVTEAALQKALKAASDKMGMGADYTLHELKRIEA